MQRRKLFLIDGMSCAYRAFYAISNLRNSSGEPTNAVYGFTNMLLKIIREQKPDALAVVFDSKAPTFRHKRYEAYKAHRKPMPEDLQVQLPVIKEVIDAYCIKRLEKDGFEADDLMGSLAVKAARRGYEVYLVTTDKDLCQIVGKEILVFRPDRNGVYDEDAVMKRFGVEPARVVDLLALAGDASDNVPGVPGIGEKTAAWLVREFGDLEGVLRNVSRVKGEKRRENLRRFADQARLSRELVLMKTDIPIKFGAEECRLGKPDRERVSELFRRLEFKKLQADVASVERPDECAYSCVNSLKELERLVGRIEKQDMVSIDLETTSGDPMRAELVGFSFSWREREGCYVPVNGNLDAGQVISRLRPVLENEGIAKVGQNIKYDIFVLRRCGVALRGIAFDTMVAAYLLNPSKPAYGLADLALDHLEMRVTPISDLIGKGRKQVSMKDVPITTVCSYACEEADVILRLKNLMEPRLRKQGLFTLFREVEMPLVEVLADMEEAGVRIDTGLLDNFSREFGYMLNELEKKIHAMAGESFNINSPRQLGRVFFERLKLPSFRKTKTGYSTDHDTLLKLSKNHPLPARVLEYRKLSKLKSTYIDALPRMVNPQTGRVHTSFNQTGTATGRLSSSNPNLQNIPVRTEIGRKIREAFIPGNKRMTLLSADYSQIDLRVLAHLSGDAELLEAFKRDEDIHRRTASAVFGVESSSVTAGMRRHAKTINFGIVYGMSAFGLARDLGIGREEAQDFIDRYFERYSGVRDYIEKSLADAASRGYVTTILNRRRYVPELNSRSHSTREFGKRMAINTPIQGSSADLIKIAMLEIQREIKRAGWRAVMLIQIHDELLFEVDREQVSSFGEMVKGKMENAKKLRVPLKARLKMGENWGQL